MHIPFADLQFVMTLCLSLSLVAQSDLGAFSSTSNSESSDNEPTSQRENEIGQEHPLVDRVIGYQEKPDDMDDTERGIIYTRVSSTVQKENFNSLSNQKRRSEESASEIDVELINPPAIDGGESGQNFDRPQIQRVKDLAEDGKIAYVFLDRLDRLGRDAQQSFEFVSHLRRNGVVLVTTQHGIIDINKPMHMMLCAYGLMSADRVIEKGAQEKDDGRRKGFASQNWASKTSKAPFGYRIGPNGWLKKKENEVEALQQAFDVFLSVPVEGAYAKTVENVPGLRKHDVKSKDLRRIMPRPVYIGKPTYGVTSEKVRLRLEEPLTVIDEDLRIISDEKFREYLDKRDAVSERYSGGKSESADVTKVAEVCGFPSVERATAEAKIHCRKPRCDSVMNHDGVRELNGEKVQQYVCPSCGAKCRYPKVRDIKEIIDFLSNYYDELGEFFDE
ncbi:recombinase family protein [Halococcus morrhuae]|uniref:recombinase family protein n=2 Tax=Halococcus morrhuae TaxID=2250 RepID=UPI0009B5B2AF|nr:recombinase family protein [Halococcus morrhuae]